MPEKTARAPRIFARVEEKAAVQEEVRDAEIEEAALPDAEQLPRPAKAHVALRDGEPVGRLHHDLQPLHAFRRELLPVHEKRIGLVGPAADPSPKLVQRGKAEALRMLHDHAARVRHVDPDLDDARRHQDLHLARGKSRHRGLLLFLGDTRMDEGHRDSLVDVVLEHAECGFRVLHVQ